MLKDSDLMSMPMMSIGTNADGDEDSVYNYTDNLTKNV
jgi:hypothetical protein